MIDEIRFLAENDQKGIAVSGLEKKGSLISISTSPLHFLVTTIGGRYLAFDADPIQGVFPNVKGSPLHDPVVQGRAYSVVDLATKLNLPRQRLVDSTRMVLLANGSSRGSVQVDMVHGILEIERSQVLSLPAQFRGPEQRWYLGMIPFDRSVALILNIAWVLEDQIQEITSRSDRRGMDPIVAVQGAAESQK